MENENLILKERIIAFVGRFQVLFILLLIIACYKAPRIIDGLTPVETVAEKIHEKSKYKFNGAKCNDGWTSHSQGQGTCSHHDGVDYYFYKGDYGKTMEECRIEAMDISWLSP